MKLHIDLRIAELLASRLCHDLVSPVGAVNNGMELLQDDLDPDMVGDAVALASGSARQASAILQFYRLAYGLAGERADNDSAQLRSLAEDFAAPRKVALDWRADPLAQSPAGTGKLLLNLIALALEVLPRGGDISVAMESEDVTRLLVSAAGHEAGLRPESRAALADEVDVEALTPRSVQAHFCHLLARRLGGDLAVDEAGDGRVELAVRLPAA